MRLFRFLKTVILAVLTALDFVLYWVAKPIGFLARPLHEGWLAGYYAVEINVMNELKEEDNE